MKGGRKWDESVSDTLSLGVTWYLLLILYVETIHYHWCHTYVLRIGLIKSRDTCEWTEVLLCSCKCAFLLQCSSWKLHLYCASQRDELLIFRLKNIYEPCIVKEMMLPFYIDYIYTLTFLHNTNSPEIFRLHVYIASNILWNLWLLWKYPQLVSVFNFTKDT